MNVVRIRSAKIERLDTDRRPVPLAAAILILISAPYHILLPIQDPWRCQRPQTVGAGGWFTLRHRPVLEAATTAGYKAVCQE